MLTQNCTISMFMAIMLAILILISDSTYAQTNYISSIIYTITWGDSPQCISNNWSNQPELDDYGDEVNWVTQPWIVTQDDQFIIADSEDNGGLKKFNSEGNLIACTSYSDIDLPFNPYYISSTDDGYVLCGMGNQLRLLDSQLFLVASFEIENEVSNSDGIFIEGIFPSISNEFYIVYNTDIFNRETYLINMSVSVILTAPILLYKRIGQDCEPCIPSAYVDPNGTTHPWFVDQYGFGYWTSSVPTGHTLTKFVNPDEPVYTHILSSDPGYTDFEVYSISPNYYLTYSGNYYTLHATAEGAVLTKYTYQCD